MRIFTPALIRHGKSKILTGLNDCIKIEKINERKIKIEKIKGYKIPTNDSNPVYKAAALMQKMKPNKLGALIKITKNIPVSYGFSSMDSNAAGTILALNKIWDFKLPETELIKIAKKISPEAALILKTYFHPLDTDKKNLILICPKYIKIDNDWLKKRIATGRNAESIIIKHFPDIKGIIEIMKLNGCKVAGIVGKGPALFGISDKPADYTKIKKALKNKSEFIWRGKSCNNCGKLLD